MKPTSVLSLSGNSAPCSRLCQTLGAVLLLFVLTISSVAQDRSTNEPSNTSRDLLLNADQRAVLNWTDKQFHGFFDSRTFVGWSQKERSDLEARLLDALKGPEALEYYQAINSLAALGSTNALPALRGIATSRQDKNNRDRWMAIRALGIMNDKSSVPDLIHLLYHGNQNTRWWAQISLVRLTGENFGTDWKAWSKWWDQSGGRPPFNPEIIRWWSEQPGPDKLAEFLSDSDRKFLEQVNPKQPKDAQAELPKQLRAAGPVMENIRDTWREMNDAVGRQDATNAVVLIKTLAPQIEAFRVRVAGTTLEAPVKQSIETLNPIQAALEKGDFQTVNTLIETLGKEGQALEEQIRTLLDNQ